MNLPSDDHHARSLQNVGVPGTKLESVDKAHSVIGPSMPASKRGWLWALLRPNQETRPFKECGGMKFSRSHLSLRPLLSSHLLLGSPLSSCLLLGSLLSSDLPPITSG